MPRDHTSYLLDMLVAAHDALALADGLSYSEFAGDKRNHLSILKSIEIVGEAASRLSEETKETYPEIPWSEIVGMRNRLVHVYFDLDLRLIWDTVCNDIPVLIAQLEQLVPTETE